MTWLDTLIKALFAIFGIGLVQIAVSYLLPEPISYIHVVLVATVLILFLYEHGSIIWLSAMWFFMLEMTTLTPFGIIFLSGIVATFCMYLLYREVFTNRSLFSAITLFSISYALYRLLYVTMYSLYALYNADIFVPFAQILHVFTLEWLVSVGFLIGVFILLRVFSRQLQRQRIEESWFKKLGS